MQFNEQVEYWLKTEIALQKRKLSELENDNGKRFINIRGYKEFIYMRKQFLQIAEKTLFNIQNNINNKDVQLKDCLTCRFENISVDELPCCSCKGYGAWKEISNQYPTKNKLK